MSTGQRRSRALRILAFVGAGILGLACAATARADETVNADCGLYPNSTFAPTAASTLQTPQTCGGPSGSLEIFNVSPVAGGARAYWSASAPAGLLIDEATVESMSVSGVNQSGSGFGGGLFWGPENSDGSAENQYDTSSPTYGVAQGTAGFPSSSFGFQVVCDNPNTCSAFATFNVYHVVLSVEETLGPSIFAGRLWAQSGWIRGRWPITVAGDSASGVCSYSASISGDPVPASASYSANPATWHQCASGGLSTTMDTTLAPNGSDTLSVSDTDAAQISNHAGKTVKIDNETPTVSFSGPTAALSTAGTQYVTANVKTGPSGAYGADCSVDGGSSTFYAGAGPQVPVSGIGEHTITCTGMSNAISSGGQRASSSSESTTLDIQQPTEEAITFSKIADELKCRTVIKRVRVLGRPHTIRRHGRKVRVVRRYHTVKRHVRKCRARTVKRRVLVALKHHGKVVRRHGKIVRVRRTERIVVLPHHVHKTVRQIKHGHRTTVSGILLTSGGTPIGGQAITVLATPNDAAPAWAPMSTAITNANGYWIAQVPPGPSRLLEAVYNGTPTTAATTSGTVRLRVPARIRIISHTARVAWGKTATFRGRVYGGYIPRGGINVRLRYGFRHQSVTYGVKTHVGPEGRFTTTFIFGPGDPRTHIRFHFQFATLPGGNYPYHTATSNSVTVRVGGHPRPRHHHRRRRRHNR